MDGNCLCWGHLIVVMLNMSQINSTENRSVLHVALRAARDKVIQSDGKNVVPDVWHVLDQIKEFSEKIRSGSWVRNGHKLLFLCLLC